MAGNLKRLRRKTRVNQRNLASFMLSTYDSWGPFVISHRHLPWFDARHWRLLCKDWNEEWTAQVEVRLDISNECLTPLYLCLSNSLEKIMLYRSTFDGRILTYVDLLPSRNFFITKMSWKAAQMVKNDKRISFTFFDILFPWLVDPLNNDRWKPERLQSSLNKEDYEGNYQ